MAAITYGYFKKRGTFGSQPLFCEQGPELCDNITPNVPEQKRYMLRNPIHENIQLGPIFSHQYVNTIRAEYSDRGMNHAEGGWPFDVNINDIESTMRYRRKMEKDDMYVHCVLHNAPVIGFYVAQNNAIEMYEHYFKELNTWPPIKSTSGRLLNAYPDVSTLNRPITSISWHAEGEKYATTYVKVDYYRRGPLTSCYIWDVQSNTTPFMTITPHSHLLDLQFGERKPNLMIGGLMNGQVGIWDLRTGKPIAFSPTHHAHRDLVRRVKFINTKSGKEFFSGSADGACKWWDIRDMSEPTDMMIMDFITSSFQVPSMATACGTTALEYEPTIPTRFMVGTENGCVFVGNRKAKSNMEKILLNFPAQVGPVFAVERNPYSLKNFLTVGSYNAKVWNEDCHESPILWTPSYKKPITSGTWSTKRLSVFFLTHSDGNLTIWDLLISQHEPVLTMKICEDKLLQVSCHENGHTLAIGSDKGEIYLVDLSPNLVESTSQDKAKFLQILERESKREKILETRMREFKLKMRAPEDEGITKAALSDEPNPAAVDKTTTTEFFQTVRKELAAFSGK